MNCELAHEWIVARAYDELSGEQEQELERHVAACPECRKESEQVWALKALVDAHPVLDPEPNLVARARLRLGEALDALPPRPWYERMGLRMKSGLAGLLAAPAAAVLLLAAGVGAGGLGGYRLAQRRMVRPVALAQTAVAVKAVRVKTAVKIEPQPELANISSISRVVYRPGSKVVDVSYSQLVRRRIEGSMDDPAIRQLLMLAAQNSPSASVREDSVALMAADCRATGTCRPTGILDALMVTLRYDKNAQVREQALNGLKPYVAQDMRVRDVVLEALLNDPDPVIRSQAISLLAPVEADTSVREVLYSVSTSDASPQIRDVSRQMLSQMPQIQ